MVHCAPRQIPSRKAYEKGPFNKGNKLKGASRLATRMQCATDQTIRIRTGPNGTSCGSGAAYRGERRLAIVALNSTRPPNASPLRS